MSVRAVYPGTFDPVHNGHVNIIQRAAALFDELYVAVYDHGRPIKSVLFNVEQRTQMLQDALNGLENITIVPYSGLTVTMAEQIGAQVIVRGLRVFSDFEFEFRMALANQRLAPSIDVVTLMAREEHTFLSGSTVREIASFKGDISSMVPPNVEKALADHFDGTSTYNRPLPLRD